MYVSCFPRIAPSISSPFKTDAVFCKIDIDFYVILDWLKDFRDFLFTIFQNSLTKIRFELKSFDLLNQSKFNKNNICYLYWLR